MFCTAYFTYLKTERFKCTYKYLYITNKGIDISEVAWTKSDRRLEPIKTLMENRNKEMATHPSKMVVYVGIQVIRQQPSCLRVYSIKAQANVFIRYF